MTKKSPSDPELPLTPREWEVFDLVIEGRTNIEIAHSLGLSPFTINNKLSSIYRKYDVFSKDHLIHKYHAERKEYYERDGRGTSPDVIG